MKWPTLSEKDIEVKIGPASAGGYATLEKNAHIDVEILDKVVGSKDWQCSYRQIFNEAFCEISILDREKKEWIHKEGLGFRGASTLWGIGRELSDIPKLILTGKAPFFVKKITYKNKKIDELIIYDSSGAIVYDKKKIVNNDLLAKVNVLPPNNCKNTENAQEKLPNAEITLSKTQISELLDLSKKLHGDNSALPINQYMVALKCKTPYLIKSIHFEKMKKYIENWDISSSPPNVGGG